MNPKDIQEEYASAIKPQNPAVKFRNGKISIQASSYSYCYPKHDHGPYSCFEVAYLEGPSESFGKIPELPPSGDDVYGYVDIKDVISLLIGEGYNKKQILEILPR